MTPDYDRAASAAIETLIRFSITSAPVAPLHILKQYPGVLADLGNYMEGYEE